MKEKEQFERERKKWKQQESRKRVKKSSKKDRGPALFKIVAIVLAVAVVLGLGSIYAGSYGVPGRFLPALTVGGQNIDAPVWAFNFLFAYQQLYQYGSFLGMKTDVSIFEQPELSPYTRGEAEDSPRMAWDEYFSKQVNVSLQNEFALYAEANKAGFELDQEAQASLEEMMAQLKTQASAAAMSPAAYLHHQYTAGLTQKKYRQLQERLRVVQGFSDQKQEEFRANHPEEELQAAYDKDPSAYNQVDFRSYTLAKEKLTANEGESAEALAVRQAAADEAVKKKAEDFLRGGEEGFLAAAQAEYDAQHVPEEGEEADQENGYDAGAATLSLRKKLADIATPYGEENAAWFFGAARKAGDATTWETDSSVYVAYLVRPAYAQTTVDFYAIDVAIEEPAPVEEGEEEPEDKPTPQEEAKQKADKLLAEWRANGGTKEAFAALQGKPALSEKVKPGDYPALDSWLFDPARKAGDATVIESSEGYTVVYLSSQNAGDYVWRTEIAGQLVSDDYDAYLKELQGQYPLGYHGVGMRYARKAARAMCDAHMEQAKSQGNGYANYDY
ncbi:MAG: hypothetical protein LBB75_06145 [Oscillospiraceae bacterium]|nr:hypothetical protein [Oscillospiraceae bacterium]